MADKKKKKEKILMPVWADIIFTAYSKLYMFFKFHMKYDRHALYEQRKKKRGCILIYTHCSNKDHYIIKASTNYKRVNFVLASYFFFNKTLNRVLSIVRSISKDQFKPDIVAIRKMRKVINAGGMIAIAPAGQTSFTGNTPFISPSIVKLIRMCKCDVIGLQLHGVYLTYPKWRRSKRKASKMCTNFVNVLNAEDIENLTDDEIYQRVCLSLDIKEFEDQKVLMRKIKGKSLAEGVEDVVVRCPKCGARCSYHATGMSATCSTCGNSFVMNKYGLLEKQKEDDIIYNDLPAWYDYEKNLLGQEFINGLELKEEVIIQTNKRDVKVLENSGEGILVLNKNEFYYEGTINGEQVKKEFHLELLTQLPFEPNVRFEVPDEEAMFRFIPKRDLRVITEYVMIIDFLNDERMK